MDQIWGDDVAPACREPRGDTVDGDIEAAFSHVAHLGVRMGMECAHCAFVKAEGNEHEFRALGEDSAVIAGGDLGPHRLICHAESFANFRCHGPLIAANVP